MAKKTVEVAIDLGELQASVEKAAKKSGVDVNEFICNALESKIRQDSDYEPRSFTPHGGKHLFGKHTGYELTKDGKYYPSPSWIGQFDLLFAERNSIYNLVNEIVRQSQERLVDVEKAIVEAKKKLIEDLGLDPALPWIYYGGADGHLQLEAPELPVAASLGEEAGK